MQTALTSVDDTQSVSSRGASLSDIFQSLDFTRIDRAKNTSSLIENISTSDIIGSHKQIGNNQLRVFHYQLCRRKFYRKRREVTLQFLDESSLNIAKTNLNKAINQSMRKVLVILNPYGGAKKASGYLKKVVQPMFAEAEISFDVIETTHVGHAKEIGYQFDKHKYGGIVAISGDGTLHEIVNGISERSDGTRVEDISIGILNGGTANCIVAAILDRRGERNCSAKKAIWNATFAYIRGTENLVDILSVKYAEDRQLYLCQSLSWGLICDVEFESEWLRRLGSSRYTVYALKHILLNKSHNGTIHYVAENIENTTEKFQQYLSNKRKESEYHTPGESWKCLKNEDFSFAALMVNGFWSLDNIASPFSQLDDGNAYLMLVPKPISRLTLLKFFLQLETGQHAFFPQIEWICVKKVRFNFGDERQLNFDGEMYNSSAIEIENVPRAVKLIY